MIATNAAVSKDLSPTTSTTPNPPQAFIAVGRNSGLERGLWFR